MFTGIVKELGVVRGIASSWRMRRLDIESGEIAKAANIGDSVAVNGVCLTVVGNRQRVLSFDVMEETIRRSNLAGLRDTDRVNLESALRAGEAMGGHFVLGHIDCAGKIVGIKKSKDDISMTIEIPRGFDALLVERGSVAADGVSLTVGEVERNQFKVHLIPHTLKVTTLGGRRAGDRLNIEFDVLGKYILKARSPRSGSGLTEDFLREKGF